MARLTRVDRVQWRTTLDVLGTVAMIAASAVLIWAILTARAAEQPTAAMPLRPTTGKPVPKGTASVAGAPVLGNPAAKVAVIEFSDYECSFCARFHENSFPVIRKSHIDTGKVLFAFRHLPLRRHALAFRAAEAAECSARVGEFWAFHEELFRSPMAIDEPSMLIKAERLGVDTGGFRACLNSGTKDRIEQDIAHAKELGITGTPSFLIGLVRPDRTVRILRHESGAIPAPVFAKMLDDALERVRSGSE